MGENKMIDPFKYGISKEYLHSIIDYFGVQDDCIDSVWQEFLLDVDAVSNSDPSQKNAINVLKNASRPMIATLIYRLCHSLSDRSLARRISEYGASVTHIDIHPDAKIGSGLFIDHGDGTVIGQTCCIGKNCRIFNNVILGSKNVHDNLAKKRHPTVGDNVTICANCRILGDIKIGDNVFVSPNCVVLDDVPNDTKISIVNQLQFADNIIKNVLPRQKLEIFGVIPKWRNSLIIEGVGIYNPTVLIKCDANINYYIDYWDKNKIIIKIKECSCDMSSLKKNKIVILSNSDKVIIINCYALTKVVI